MHDSCQMATRVIGAGIRPCKEALASESGLSDPVKLGEAVVLIDELDHHLTEVAADHVERLTKVFPRCQFIATTHAPQIVAAVEPEQVSF